MSGPVDVLIPTCRRPAALAVTLTSLAGQTQRGLRIVVSDQTEDEPALGAPEVRAVVRVLDALGHRVELHRHLPRRGDAEHRQFLLAQVRRPYCLFVDDDVILEPDLVARLLGVIREHGCGFVGSAVIGLSFRDDVRPEEQAIDLWPGRVEPETVRPGTAAWERHRLHNAANLYHVQRALGMTRARQRVYRVAWVGGCVLYDAVALRAAGGFDSWRDLAPGHGGEDVLAQQRVMARAGGCGLIPSGVYRQELPTTVADRAVDAPGAFPGR